MPPTPLKRAKDAMRAEFSAKRDSMDASERDKRDLKICEYAKNLVSFRHADIILLYHPIKSEINALYIAEAAIKAGKRVAFPKCDTETRNMTFYFINSIDNDFELGAYGIKEPKETLEIYDPTNTSGIALCFLPGLAFDVYGYRLGYGKGYYDKFLGKFKGCTIGLTYTELINSSVPRGRFDLHCDILLTERGTKQIKAEKTK